MRWRVLTATSSHIILRRAVFQGAFRPSLLGHVETRRRPVSTVCHRGSLHFLWNNLVQAIPPTARRSQNQGKRLGRGWRANFCIFAVVFLFNALVLTPKIMVEEARQKFLERVPRASEQEE